MASMERLWLHLALRVKGFLREERGQNTTEYILILGLIVAVVVGLITVFGDNLVEWWEAVTDEIFG